MACGSCGTTSTCSCSDNVLTFPAGPEGPKGVKGDTGPKGDTGATGAAGIDGGLGPVTVTKFVKDFSVSGNATDTNVSVLSVVTAAELTAAGMLRTVYDANALTSGVTASAMDFNYQIWYRDDTTATPNVIWKSATEGTSPRCTDVSVNSLSNIDLTFANGGGSYRIVIEG